MNERSYRPPPPSSVWGRRQLPPRRQSHVDWGRVVLERLPLRGDETVIDAGCGTGRLTELLLARLPEGHVIGLDNRPT